MKNGFDGYYTHSLAIEDGASHCQVTRSHCLLYGEEYGIEVYSEIGEGTSIIIKLPKIEYMT